MATRSTALLGHYAGFVSRAAALLMDILVVIAAITIINVVVALPLSFFLDIDVTTCMQDVGRSANIDMLFCRAINLIWLLVALLTAPVYFIFLFAANGQTIGKYVMGVRVVRIDGRPMSFKSGLLRFLGYWVSLIPLGLGFFWVVIDSRRLAFHDHLAKTCVVYSWRAYGDDYLLERVTDWFRHRRKGGAAPLQAPAVTDALLHNYDLVTLAVPTLARAEGLLGLLNDLVGRGTIDVELTMLVAKDGAENVGIISFNDLSTGSSWAPTLHAQGQLLGGQRQMIAADLPADTFAVVVMVLDKWADELVKQVSRQAAVVVRRYDLGAVPTGAPTSGTNGIVPAATPADAR